VGYFAPEILAGPYTNKIDIFSSGIVLFILMTGKHPWKLSAGNEDHVMKLNQLGEINFHPAEWNEKNPLAIDLIKRMTALDPDIRPTAREALQHPFFDVLAEVKKQDDEYDIANVRTGSTWNFDAYMENNPEEVN